MHQQLDTFDDGRDVALRNDLAQAVLDAKPTAARCIADTLKAEFGADHVLAPADALIEHLHWRESLAATGDKLEVATILGARRRIDDSVAAAAEAVLGAQEATAWLAGQWC
jgi:hypothetical protein